MLAPLPPLTKRITGPSEARTACPQGENVSQAVQAVRAAQALFSTPAIIPAPMSYRPNRAHAKAQAEAKKTRYDAVMSASVVTPMRIRDQGFPRQGDSRPAACNSNLSKYKPGLGASSFSDEEE
ncbi:hypothetical protein FCIRC_12205 [Fusarium circinatum]|uniref:Uncharacterized protein n=1 Tax=Fusarium circinatum TaxID=48490 RepID=A0A8H5WF45_FUSCI|nr:hypothetical protein FCIRC_12205 [Fusarium circinatum]